MHGICLGNGHPRLLANGVQSQESLDLWSYGHCPNFPQPTMITHRPFEHKKIHTKVTLDDNIGSTVPTHIVMLCKLCPLFNLLINNSMLI